MRLTFIVKSILCFYCQGHARSSSPGVEFNDDGAADYIPDRAAHLRKFAEDCRSVAYEAHSTDYQTLQSIRRLVLDHFCILKVGPELTFMMREAIFGLANIEREWVKRDLQSDLRETIDRVMVQRPADWHGYYRGDEQKLRFYRSYSFSDRIRYYWLDQEVAKCLGCMIRNLADAPAPLPLIEQYLPIQAEKIRRGELSNEPGALIRDKVRDSLRRYAMACGF